MTTSSFPNIYSTSLQDRGVYIWTYHRCGFDAKWKTITYKAQFWIIQTSIYDQEMYALVQTMKHWQHYVVKIETIVYSHHKPLQFQENFEEKVQTWDYSSSCLTFHSTSLWDRWDRWIHLDMPWAWFWCSTKDLLHTTPRLFQTQFWIIQCMTKRCTTSSSNETLATLCGQNRNNYTQ